ncbi:MAG TPA: aliphatic sulfonate ABC transporter substrate-binding protein [Polyangia bacterium]|nr:aliphatic sulfonate ABC transporter substrate-binding protein [Polyangia bacterium]
MSRGRLALAAACLLAGLGGCRRGAPAAATDAPPESALTVTVGYQRSSWAFLYLRHQGWLDARLAAAGAKVRWLEFTAGPPILEGMNAGSVDVALVGDAPPLFAQAGGLHFAYAAVEPPKPEAAAVLVLADSPLRRISELAGKKVALQKGSSAQHLLLESLRAAGMTWADIQPVYLAPPDARAAFEHGSVDAWAIWDPYYAAAQQQLRARPLQGPLPRFSYRQFLVVRPELPQAHRPAYDQLLAALADAERQIQQAPDEAATLLAADAHIDAQILTRALRRSQFGLRPIDNEVWSEQQVLADEFAKLRLIGRAPDVRAAALSLPAASLPVGSALASGTRQ